MQRNIIFSIFGCDARQLWIADELISRGHQVRLCLYQAMKESLSGCKIYLDWRQAVEGCDIIILPLPASKDGKNVSFTSEGVLLKDVIETAIKSGCSYILGGLIDPNLIETYGDKINFIDYYASETLQEKNALPSAEGALMLMMEHTARVIEGSHVLISGYGRIGKRLSEILQKLGARVTIAARSEQALSDAAIKGFEAVQIYNDNIDLSNKSFDVIFNTVPHQIFSKRAIETIGGKPIYIEIASSPYGIDVAAARDRGISVVFAPSIPSKYAPETAGVYIYESICDALEQRGVSI
jgi:dipicolinate synthase subunit A